MLQEIIDYTCDIGVRINWLNLIEEQKLEIKILSITWLFFSLLLDGR